MTGARVSRKWVSWAPATSDEVGARQLISAALYLHSTFKEEYWLWRGQANGSYGLEPGMHTRLRKSSGLSLDERNAAWATGQLVELARQMKLDRFEGARLPDLALLAHLQHHGAGTPLMDVSVDPLVALWMVVFASADEPHGHDEDTGALFAIRRPDSDHYLDPLDARPYWAEEGPSVAATLDGSMWWYRAPDVSERLRIQRGSFLLGPLVGDDPTTLPLNWSQTVPAGGSNWLRRRIGSLGTQARPVDAATDVVVLRVPPSLKPILRGWLLERAGLSIATVYPTPWHRPYVEEFSQSYGRTRPIDH